MYTCIDDNSVTHTHSLSLAFFLITLYSEMIGVLMLNITAVSDKTLWLAMKSSSVINGIKWIRVVKPTVSFMTLVTPATVGGNN